MTRHLTIAALVAAAGLCAALGGCAGSGGQFSAQALGNLQYCERSYTAIIGALGANGGSLNVRCPARPFPAEAAVAAAPASGPASGPAAEPALLGQ